jgi:HEAT repeat protein
LEELPFYLKAISEGELVMNTTNTSLFLLLMFFQFLFAQEPNESLQDLLGKIKSGQEEQRVQAIASLGNMGQKASPAIPILAETLWDVSPNVQLATVKALLDIGDEGVSVLRRSMQKNHEILLQDRDPWVKRSTVEFLEKLPEIPTTYLSFLIQMVKDPALPKQRTRELFGKLDMAAIPDLIRSLQEDREEVRDVVVDTLIRLHQKLKIPLAELTVLLQHANSEVRLSAASLLLQIYREESADLIVPLLIECLSHDTPKCWQKAAQILGSMGKRAKESLPALKRALQKGGGYETNNVMKESIKKIERSE